MYYSISIFPTLRFFWAGGRGGGSQDHKTPEKQHPDNFDIYKKIGIRISLYILLLIYSSVQNSANLCFYSILSDTSGLMQGSLVNYVFLNSISQLLTLNPSNHEIITLASFLEFDICYLSCFVDCWIMTILNIVIYTINLYVFELRCRVWKKGKLHQTWNFENL